MKKTKNYGFTIVELVIVIAVIAILSAVLIPTLGGVIEDAQNTSRDAKAKNAYTNYITYHPTEDNSYLFIEIEDGGATYYYSVNDGQIDLDNEGESLTILHENGIHGNGYVVYLPSANQLWLNEWNNTVEYGNKELSGVYIRYSSLVDSTTAIQYTLGNNYFSYFTSFLIDESISFAELEITDEDYVAQYQRVYSVSLINDPVGGGSLDFIIDENGYVYSGNLAVNTSASNKVMRSKEPISLDNMEEFYKGAKQTGVVLSDTLMEQHLESGLAYTDWTTTASGFERFFGTEEADRVSYGYELTPTSDDNRADVSVVIKVYVGGVCYNATAAGKVHAYTLPSGDTLWEGPIDGEIVIGESREKIIVGFTRIESSGESLLSLNVSDRNCVISFGEDIIKGEVKDFLMEQSGIEG